jgi:hypothetical protein
MSIDGTWDITVSTPMGAQESTAEFKTDGSTLTGTNAGAGATMDIYDGSVDGDSATWKIDMTQPFPMTLLFTAEVDGDKISGEAKAGAFPASPFTGTRSS